MPALERLARTLRLISVSSLMRLICVSKSPGGVWPNGPRDCDTNGTKTWVHETNRPGAEGPPRAGRSSVEAALLEAGVRPEQVGGDLLPPEHHDGPALVVRTPGDQRAQARVGLREQVRLERLARVVVGTLAVDLPVRHHPVPLAGGLVRGQVGLVEPEVGRGARGRHGAGRARAARAARRRGLGPGDRGVTDDQRQGLRLGLRRGLVTRGGAGDDRGRVDQGEGRAGLRGLAGERHERGGGRVARDRAPEGVQQRGAPGLVPGVEHEPQGGLQRSLHVRHLVRHAQGPQHAVGGLAGVVGVLPVRTLRVQDHQERRDTGHEGLEARVLRGRLGGGRGDHRGGLGGGGERGDDGTGAGRHGNLRGDERRSRPAGTGPACVARRCAPPAGENGKERFPCQSTEARKPLPILLCPIGNVARRTRFVPLSVSRDGIGTIAGWRLSATGRGGLPRGYLTTDC